MGSPAEIQRWGESLRVAAASADPGRLVARVAFAGRTSTEDQQDPTLSLPRQLRRCSAVIPEDAVIVAHFFDIESGRMDLASRGRGSAHELFDIPIPRDGGIQDLLAEAERPDRRFDYVICESIDRIARRTYYGTYIEHHLEKVGVRLLAADEPIQIGTSGRRKASATTVLTRRVKQGIAEWYVLEMLEKSWDGFAVHTEQGFNIGKPPYGYRAVQIPHAVPAKRAKGVKKTRLVPDPVEGAVVRQIFAWRIGERLSYQQIADRLNDDLVAHPPPTPVDPARAVGRWTISNVREIITNPKHTGHMVWGRRARKRGRNRANPVEDWIWSPQPTHDAYVTLEGFVQVQQIASQHAKSRSAGGRNRHPQTRRLYRLRSHMFCDLCGRRMYGRTKNGVSAGPSDQYTPTDLGDGDGGLAGRRRGRGAPVELTQVGTGRFDRAEKGVWLTDGLAALHGRPPAGPGVTPVRRWPPPGDEHLDHDPAEAMEARM